MADLVDVRSKVSEHAHMALLAEERATGKSHSELIRELVEAWAEQRIRAATVLCRLMRSNEPDAADQGSAGK